MHHSAPEYLTTSEVAALLRLKERKVYELVSTGKIPCVRATGKLLFPHKLINEWLRSHLEYTPDTTNLIPPALICTGSHDPLLDWALREAQTEIAVHFNGSLAGLEQLAVGRVIMAGTHIREQQGASWNRRHVQSLEGAPPLVLLEWAKRQQGLIVANGNPLQIHALEDLRHVRVIDRQPKAGAYILMQQLLKEAAIERSELLTLEQPARTENDVAAAVATDQADAGLGIAAAARQYHLDFIPLIMERYDLAIQRHWFFEPELQQLWQFCKTTHFTEQAALLDYDISQQGHVHYNTP
ncbi:MAG TPA: helix-turn-helix domain-containing protein [Gammaproteobacteria bacterium]|nr:helix-turn-helix domain-containing protein [Gammaproteobacteria bacterium]